ncbi:MAG: hypothetical protein ACRC0F_12065 [Cetobacterium sp.]
MVRRTENRVGEKRKNNKGVSCTIVEYRSATDVVVRFDMSGYTKRTNYQNFKNGKIDDKLSPSVMGVGCLGDASASIDGKSKTHILFGLV